MSQGERFEHFVALAAARHLLAELRPLAHRIICAGSLRRRKPDVGDIEILYIPKAERQGTLFGNVEGPPMTDALFARWMACGIIEKRGGWGPKNKFARLGVMLPFPRIPLDLFSTTPENWWVSLVIRTGGRTTNLSLTTGAQRLGRKLHAYGDGITDENGRSVAATSEAHVFELCGVPYREPWERQ